MAQDKVLTVEFPGSTGALKYGPASEAILRRRARDIYQAGGTTCVYRIDGQPLALDDPPLRVAPTEPQTAPEPTQAEEPPTAEEPQAVQAKPVRRMPTRPVPRPPDPDDFVGSSFRVTEMQHECIARALEVTRKTHDLISDLNNSFANERLSLFRLKEHERKSEEPGGMEALLGLAKMMFGHLKNRKAK